MPLTDSLVSHWKLDEASGSRADSHGSETLADNNTVGSAGGKIGNAADFEVGNSEYLDRATNSNLETGDIDFTFAAWVNLESKTASMMVVSKDHDTGREYHLWWYDGSDRFVFTVDTTSLVDAVLGAPSTATWYFLVAWHDSVANTINLQINNGTANSVSYSGGNTAGPAQFMIGARHYPFVPDFFDGLIDEVSFWKRVLTAPERTTLYNGGAGLAYPFSAGTNPKGPLGNPLFGPLGGPV